MFFWFSSNRWIIQFFVLFSSRRYFLPSLSLFGSHTYESMDFYFIIVLMTNNCSIIKDLKAVISVLNADIFSSREITVFKYYMCFIWLQFFFSFYWWCFTIYWKWNWFKLLLLVDLLSILLLLVKEDSSILKSFFYNSDVHVGIFLTLCI